MPSPRIVPVRPDPRGHRHRTAVKACPGPDPLKPYLDWLRDRVRLARETHPDFKGEWVYFFISTAAE